MFCGVLQTGCELARKKAELCNSCTKQTGQKKGSGGQRKESVLLGQRKENRVKTIPVFGVVGEHMKKVVLLILSVI